MYDLAIVGGGPAGISTALHLHALAPALAERTIVLERETYPREKYCAGGLGGRALKLLAKIDVRPDVPAVTLGGVSIRFEEHELSVREPGFGLVVRRMEFDHALAKIAVARGIRVREGVSVREVEATADGVRLRSAEGEEFQARAVVGADGVGGIVRRRLGLSGGRLRAQVIELDTEEVEGDPARDTIRFDGTTRALNGYAWDFPTLVDGAPMMCRGVYVLPGLGADSVRDRLRRYLEAKGLQMDRYRLKPFGERGFDAREPIARPNGLLVGEAAGIDIATGEGIAQAIQYGEVAARYLARAFHRKDLRFLDWSRAVRWSGLGANLFTRTAMYRTFYFRRGPMERLLRANPALLQLYAREFAGNPLGFRTLCAAVAHMPVRLVPWLLRRAFFPEEEEKPGQDAA